MLLPYGLFDNIEILSNGDGWFEPELLKVFKNVPEIHAYLTELGRADLVPEVFQCLNNFLKCN
ncbi:MAG: hypothetical protein K8R11_10405 [Methanococcoides sp.]|nr:hypothetical protein [Methanococcoides sp.]